MVTVTGMSRAKRATMTDLGRLLRERRNADSLLVLFATSIGGFFRFYRLARLSLNHDEPFTAYIVGYGTWSQIATSMVPTERGTPPLYFLLLKLWCTLFGNSESALRFPSALLGTLSIIAIAAVGRELYSADVGAGAAVLLALNPMHIDASRDARFYPLFVFLVLINCWYFAALIKRPSQLKKLLFATTLALAVYAHLYAAFFFLAELTWLMCEWIHGRKVRDGLGAFGLGVIFLTPYLIILGSAFNVRANEQLGWATGLNYAAPLLFYRAASGSLLFPVMLALAGLAWKRSGDDISVVLHWALVPTLAVYLASFVYPHRLIFTSRYLFSVVPAILLLSATGLSHVRSHSNTAYAIILAGALAVGVFAFERVIHFKSRDWVGIAAAVKMRAGHDTVAIDSYSAHLLKYYLNNDPLKLITLHCSSASLRDRGLQTGPAIKSLWYVNMTDNPCDRALLKSLSSQYEVAEQSELDRNTEFIHFTK